ncbi:MAG: FtsW/RodA/SpoVE family cell cycle protein [Firmicutes bacterium]|nr:FtsW/RodA/SpoVE family cell cycle protein [Bacillota bacterium]
MGNAQKASGMQVNPFTSRNRRRPNERGRVVLIVPLAFLGVLLAVHGREQSVYWAFLFAFCLGTAFVGLHAVFCLADFTGDENLLPLCGFICVMGLVILSGGSLSLAVQQLKWILLGIFLVPWIALPRFWVRLEDYRYLVATLGLVLLFLTVFFGIQRGGARLWLSCGFLQFQPGEIVRPALGIFLAALFSENRLLLAHPTCKWGCFRIPEPRYLLPLLLMWLLFLFVLVAQKDLGAALVYYLLFAGLGFAATGQVSYLIYPAILGALGGGLAWFAFPHVRLRFAIWIDPWQNLFGGGYQIVQALFALANGGWMGRGLGQGYSHALPAAYTDLPLAVLGEELGFLGLLAVLTGYFLLFTRGLYIAYRCSHEFWRLLGIAVVIGWGLSAFLVNGGILRLVPLTGLVTPFFSYGGSAMVTNFVCLGLLLNLSRKELWR